MKRLLSFSSGFFASCLLAMQPAARANVIEPTPALPPTVGGYVLQTICLTLACLQNGIISNFNLPNVSFGTGNEVESGTATFAGNLFANLGTVPSPVIGPFLGTFSGTANIGLEFIGRGSPNQLGTFTGEITNFSFSSGLLGHTFSVILNPNIPSTGTTTISAVRPDGPFSVNSFFDVFVELSIDNGPFVPGPERDADLTSTPEPSSILLFLSAAAAILGIRRVHSRRARA